jgi:hypothetical protein
MARKSRQSKKSGRASRASRKSTPSRKRKQRTAMSSRLLMPRTAKLATSKTPVRKKFSRARAEMPITDLQFMAKSLGIPFGGLSKTQLVRKINAYA